VWQMGDDERVWKGAMGWSGRVNNVGYCFVSSKLTWYATMLMNHDQIGDLVRSTCFHQILDDVITTIDPVRVGKHQSEFLAIASTR
jgi:hypothetical protein